jgi:hypothetical protein
MFSVDDFRDLVMTISMTISAQFFPKENNTRINILMNNQHLMLSHETLRILHTSSGIASTLQPAAITNSKTPLVRQATTRITVGAGLRK